jgi:hypothetical protein
MSHAIHYKAIVYKEQVLRPVYGHNTINQSVMVLIAGQYEWRQYKTLIAGFTDQETGSIYFEGDVLYEKIKDEHEQLGYCEIYNLVVFKNGAFGWIGEVTGEFFPFSEHPIEREKCIGNIHEDKKLALKVTSIKSRK